MGAYKKLNKQDAFITTYTAHKTWAVQSSDFSQSGIEVNPVQGNLYTSLTQLYYPKKQSGIIPSHSFDYYNQTTLYNSESRKDPINAVVISIPRNLYGTAINNNGSFIINKGTSTESTYVDDEYWVVGYTESTSGSSNTTIVDDREGNLYILGSSPRLYVGDIIYPHGIVVITDPYYATISIDTLEFQSSNPIYTHNYHCKLRESEYNYTYNPSSLSSSLKEAYYSDGELYSTSSVFTNGELKNNITGSTFQPYITTVGLYNDANELIAVGKMSQPIPKSLNTEMTLIVKIDI